jgi:hypothetical protein
MSGRVDNRHIVKDMAEEGKIERNPLRIPRSPGPWDSNPMGHHVTDAHGSVVCSVATSFDAPTIAAAPEMLEALEELIAELKKLTPFQVMMMHKLFRSPAIQKAIAAAAKAREFPKRPAMVATYKDSATGTIYDANYGIIEKDLVIFSRNDDDPLAIRIVREWRNVAFLEAAARLLQDFLDIPEKEVSWAVNSYR